MEDGFMKDDVRIHCVHTRSICERVCNVLNIKDNVKDLLNAAELHDLGKFYIPEYVLNAPRPLQETERFVVDMHASYGYSKLKELGYNELLSQLVLLHHGLNKYKCIQEEDLLEDAVLLYPILMVADMYDALTSERPYRSAMGKEKALEIIKGMPEISETVYNALVAVIVNS